MCVNVNSNQYAEPMYFHREYENDVKMPNLIMADQSWLSLSQRVAFASLPIFSLYKPFSVPIALVMGSVRVYSSASELYSLIQEGNVQEISKGVMLTSIAVASLAGTILMHPLGMLITTGQDMAIECGYLMQHLNEGEYIKAAERTASLVNNTLYLGVLVTGSLELSVASLSIQVLLGVYHSCDEFNRGCWIEGTSRLLMSAIRTHQVVGQVKLIHIRNEIIQNIRTYLKEELLQDIKRYASSKTETSYAANVQSMTANKSQRYEAYSVYTTIYGGYKFHVADYRGNTRVVTCLDGGMRGVQGVSVNGVQIAESRSVTWYPNYFVHRYVDAVIYSYENRQICEIYG